MAKKGFDRAQLYEQLALPKRRIGSTPCAVAIACTALIVGGFAGYSLEQVNSGTLPPVTANMRSETFTASEHKFISHITGEKQFDCEYLGAVGWATSGEWRRVSFKFLPELTKRPISRNPGFQSFGLWQWEIRPGDFSVKTIVQHKCDGKHRETTIGPFPLPYNKFQ